MTLAALLSSDVHAWLAEDIGRAGDLTTDAIIPATSVARFQVVTRERGVASGLEVARQVWLTVEPELAVSPRVVDGSRVNPGDALLEVEGPARGILTGERVALNILGRMSGIATATAQLVDRISGTRTRITDTRKTTPGLRALEKAAVRHGGGMNHRFGLDDAVLIKDNHIAVAGSVTEAVRRARASVGHLVKIEVEVDTLAQLDELLEVGADAVLLDNMSPEQLRTAVTRVAGRMVTEASGNIDVASVVDVAETGVDVISVGALTHSAPALDLGLDAV